jgi:hypothetical protein
VQINYAGVPFFCHFIYFATVATSKPHAWSAMAGVSPYSVYITPLHTLLVGDNTNKAQHQQRRRSHAFAGILPLLEAFHFSRGTPRNILKHADYQVFYFLTNDQYALTC